MHLKKSETQIGEDSEGLSADLSYPLLEIHISNPNSDYGLTPQSSHVTSVHGLPQVTTPHKRTVTNHSAAAGAAAAAISETHCRPISAIRRPTSYLLRLLLWLPLSSAIRSNIHHLLRRLRFRLRLVFLLSFPFIYFLFVTLFSSSPPSALERSFLIDFFLAVAFYSSIFFLLCFSINLFPLSSLRLLLSWSSSLLPRCYRISPRRVQWTIGSSKEFPESGNGSLSGFSTQVYSNGDVFEGEFHKGKCSGSGVYYYNMSGRYEGDWVDNQYDGYGIEIWAKGSLYKGQYRQGLRHGLGVYHFFTGDVYAGEWSNGQSHGSGLHTCEDGSRYVGEFKCGAKHGFGHYHFRNGDTYAGEYFGDMMHGYGVYRFANGQQYEGAWHEGRRQGLGMYTFRNGDTLPGHWHNGALSTPNPTTIFPFDLSKVPHAVQEARRAARRAFDLPKTDDRVSRAISAVNKATSAARVAAVKAVQARFSASC